MIYNAGFQPDGSTPEGRFLMSAIYENITVVKGGTEQAPISLPLPTSKVELIRAMAKVEVIFPQESAGQYPSGSCRDFCSTEECCFQFVRTSL